MPTVSWGHSKVPALDLRQTCSMGWYGWKLDHTWFLELQVTSVRLEQKHIEYLTTNLLRRQRLSLRAPTQCWTNRYYYRVYESCSQYLLVSRTFLRAHSTGAYSDEAALHA